MKRKFHVLILSAAVIAASCSVVLAAGEAEPEMEPEEILENLETVNSIDKLAEDYGSVGINYTDYVDDKGYERYFYSDAQRYAWEYSDGQIEIMDNSEEIDAKGYNAGIQKVYVMTYADKAMFRKTLEESSPAGTFIYAEGEKIISDENTEEGRKIITEMSAEDYRIPGVADVISDEEICRTEYLVDPETWFLKEAKETAVSPEGEERLLCETTVTPGAEKYELPAEYQALLDAEDTRSITVVVDPGTEEEQTFQRDVAKGCVGAILAPEGYEVYDDKECIKIHTTTTDLENNQTLYVAKAV